MQRSRHLFLCLLATAAAPLPVLADAGRYLSWIDDSGQVHNTFVDAGYGQQQRQAARRIDQSDRARLRDDGGTLWPGSAPAGESKRRYFTWVDGQGNLQNSFYAGNQVPAGRGDYVLPNGDRSSEYIDAEAYEDKGFVRSENGNPYYTKTPVAKWGVKKGTPLKVDGSAGKWFWYEFQRYLKDRKFYTGILDGDPKKMTYEAIQRWLNDNNDY